MQVKLEMHDSRAGIYAVFLNRFNLENDDLRVSLHFSVVYTFANIQRSNISTNELYGLKNSWVVLETSTTAIFTAGFREYSRYRLSHLRPLISIKYWYFTGGRVACIII